MTGTDYHKRAQGAQRVTEKRNAAVGIQWLNRRKRRKQRGNISSKSQAPSSREAPNTKLQIGLMATKGQLRDHGPPAFARGFGEAGGTTGLRDPGSEKRKAEGGNRR